MGRTYTVHVQEKRKSNGCFWFLGIFLLLGVIGDNAGAILSVLAGVGIVAGAGYLGFKALGWLQQAQSMRAQAEALANQSAELSQAMVNTLDEAIDDLNVLLNSWANVKDTKGIGTAAEALLADYNSVHPSEAVHHLRDTEETATTTLNRALLKRAEAAAALEAAQPSESADEDGALQHSLAAASWEVRDADRQLRAAIFYAVHNS